MQRTIDQSAALRRLHQKVEALNAAMPVKTHKRTMASGSEKVVITRPKRVNASTKATAEHLVKAYVREFYRTTRTLGNATDEVPSLLTNGVEIAAWRSFSDRTSRNHIATLRECGIISDYKFRGSQADFEVWISPEILFDAPTSTVENSNFSTLISSALGEMSKNFPHKVTVTHSNLEIEIDNVSCEHSDQQKAVAAAIHSDIHGDTEQHQPEANTPTSPCHSDNQQGGAAAGGPRAKTRHIQRTEAQRQAIFEGFLGSFWLYAKQLLYPSRSFQSWEDARALATIRRSVYFHFDTEWTEKEWDTYQKSLYARLEMVARYYAKHPDRYIPEPYAWGREGAGYFDWENERGFRATEAWFQKSQQLYRTHYLRTRVSQAIRILQKHRCGTAPVKYQRLSYLEAYRSLENTLEKYGEVTVNRYRDLASTIGQAKPHTSAQGFTRTHKRTN